MDKMRTKGLEIRLNIILNSMEMEIIQMEIIQMEMAKNKNVTF